MAHGRKTGGRKVGTPNKHSAELKAAVEARCRALIEEPGYAKFFQARLNSGDLAPALEALTWHYAYGKPIERQEVTGPNGDAIVFRWQE